MRYEKSILGGIQTKTDLVPMTRAKTVMRKAYLAPLAQRANRCIKAIF